MTDKLYYKDAYIREFTAAVTSCDEAEDGTYRIVLDKTAFFPEAGGQKSDNGRIGDANVIEVHENGGEVVHYTDKSVSVGSVVKCALNWPERFEKMQSHSGEHIISALVHNEFGYENVGFHLEDDCVTFDFNGKLSENDILRIETAANDIIYEDRPIKTYFPDDGELKNMKYRSKLELTHDVRIVEIEGLDLCACCAPHVSGTAQIGILKILNFYPHRGGTRIEMVCGRRAYTDYRTLHGQNAEIMRLISAKRFETAEGVRAISAAFGKAKAENCVLQNELAVSKLTFETFNDTVCAWTSEADYDGLRACINHIKTQTVQEYVAVFSENPDGIIYACESRTEPIKVFVSKLNSLLGGRGGGRDFYAQGKIAVGKGEAMTVLRLGLQ